MSRSPHASRREDLYGPVCHFSERALPRKFVKRSRSVLLVVFVVVFVIVFFFFFVIVCVSVFVFVVSGLDLCCVVLCCVALSCLLLSCLVLSCLVLLSCLRRRLRLVLTGIAFLVCPCLVNVLAL